MSSVPIPEIRVAEHRFHDGALVDRAHARL